jgi:hypothetical protein
MAQKYRRCPRWRISLKDASDAADKIKGMTIRQGRIETDVLPDDRVQASFQLNEAPSPEWRAMFLTNPSGAAVKQSWDFGFEVTPKQAVLIAKCSDTTFEELVHHVDTRIKATNEAYERQQAEKKKADEAAASKKEADDAALDTKRRDLQARADRLSKSLDLDPGS